MKAILRYNKTNLRHALRKRLLLQIIAYKNELVVKPSNLTICITLYCKIFCR